MKEGEKKLLKLLRDFESINISDKTTVWNTEIIEALELHNLLLQSIVSVRSALDRKESRGAHARIDFEDRNDKDWLKHTLISIDSQGKSILNYRHVNLKTKTKEIKSIEPKARVY